MDIQEWKFDTELMLKLTQIHDINFRRNYLGKRTNEIIYSDGCWYCDDGVFERQDTGETVENIIINNNSTVDITMNYNLSQIVLDSNLTIVDWITRDGHKMIEWNVKY
jgi:hypothetical protein